MVGFVVCRVWEGGGAPSIWEGRYQIVSFTELLRSPAGHTFAMDTGGRQDGSPKPEGNFQVCFCDGCSRWFLPRPVLAGSRRLPKGGVMYPVFVANFAVPCLLCTLQGTRAKQQKRKRVAEEASRPSSTRASPKAFVGRSRADYYAKASRPSSTGASPKAFVGRSRADYYAKASRTSSTGASHTAYYTKASRRSFYGPSTKASGYYTRSSAARASTGSSSEGDAYIMSSRSRLGYMHAFLCLEESN